MTKFAEQVRQFLANKSYEPAAPQATDAPTSDKHGCKDVQGCSQKQSCEGDDD